MYFSLYVLYRWCLHLYVFCSCLCVILYFCTFFLVDVFFFFKQNTEYEMRISDGSSDVCSSDLYKRCQSLGLKGVQLIPVGSFYFKPLHGRRAIERSQTHGVSVILFIWSITASARPAKLKLSWQPQRNYRKQRDKQDSTEERRVGQEGVST